MATQEYYIRNGNETEARGPFNFEQLTSLLDSGQLTLETLYYDATTDQWITIGSSAELKLALFPEKKKLVVRAKQNLKTLNTTSDNQAPITVDDMLAAAEGRTSDTGDKKDPAIAMARAAAIGTWSVIGMLLISAAGEILPSIDFLLAFNPAEFLAHPLLILGVLDLILAILLGLGMVTLYPFVRFRAALALGFLGFFFYTQSLNLPLLAVCAGSTGLYLCTVSVSLFPVILAAALGLAGMAGVTCHVLTR
jgi:hypothetical protein